MRKITNKLDTLLILNSGDGPYEEHRYVPAAWPKDDQGKDLDTFLCGWDGSVVVDNRLEVAKEFKDAEISASYSQEFITGFFHSEVMGIDIDYRRNGTKNDLQNVDVLIEVMTDTGTTETEFRGYQDQKANVTLDQIKAMRKEMLLYSTTLYGKKEGLENQVLAAVTIEEVQAIKW